MKQKDIVLILVVAFVSGVLSFVLANLLFGGEKSYNLKAPTIDAISADFKQPNTTYFNSNALNPTKNIVIGDSTNNQPFKSN
ncbi:MAG: hypothetical protein U0491_00295 [Candidatus Saccharimonadales bacterium]